MPPKIQPGDLVRRKYHISRPDWKYTEFGFVIERDNNGFFDILWGSKIEHMWDEYDLMRVDDQVHG